MRRGSIALVIVAVVLLLGLGYCGYASTQPPDRHDYRVTAVEAAQAAHDALTTAYLAGVALRDGKATSLYVTVLLNDGAERTAQTLRKFAQLSPPDDDMRALRDELAPLLTETVQRLGDAAADPTEVEALPPLTDRLTAVLERYR